MGYDDALAPMIAPSPTVAPKYNYPKNNRNVVTDNYRSLANSVNVIFFYSLESAPNGIT
jgi:hypothetical protein